MIVYESNETHQLNETCCGSIVHFQIGDIRIKPYVIRVGGKYFCDTYVKSYMKHLTAQCWPSLHWSRFNTNFTCCVFLPANGCSMHRSLVEINFFDVKPFFPSLREQNKEKRKESHTKTCNKRGVHQPIFPRSQPAFGCQPAFKSNT